MNIIRIKSLLLLALLSQCSVYKKNYMYHPQSSPSRRGIDYNLTFLSRVREEYQKQNNEGITWPYKYIGFLDYINQFSETHFYPFEFYKITGNFEESESLALFVRSLKDYQNSITPILKYTNDPNLQRKIDEILKNPWCIGKDNNYYYFIELKQEYEFGGNEEDVQVYKYEYGLNNITVYMHDIVALKKFLQCNVNLKNENLSP